MTTTTPEQADTLPAEAIEAAAEALYTADYRNGESFAKYPVGSYWGDRYRSEAHAALLAALPHLARRADDHYFAVDYTGCIHEAPDRETAIKWAEDFARTANGGAIGSERPEVAAAIGSLARRTPTPYEQEPVAYLIEDSPVQGIRAIVWPGDRELQQAIKKKPQAKTTPLYAHPAPAAGVKVKPPKWHHEVAIGASTSEKWLASTPEGQRLTVTYDESCELPWVACPFPPGPSNYATADEAKAALEAAREARIRRALDTGEPK